MPPVPKRPPVARERVIPRTPAGPPWKLISPTGVRHVIEDREAIKGAAQTHRPSGGQSPRRALERSPHALFKLRQKAKCVWLVAEVDRMGRVTIGLHLDGLLLQVRATAATAAATSFA